MVSKIKVLMAAAALAAVAASADAAPTCSTTTDIGMGAVVTWSSLGSGACIKSGDKVYGNFVAGNLPADTVLIFNSNVVGSLTHQQLSFDGTYMAGTTYTWGYEVAVATGAPAGTVITTIDSDFTQTASDGASTLDKMLDPAGDASIHEVKIGAFVQPGSVLSASFGAGVTDVKISESLIDNGTISSVTNTITEFSPGSNIPEPLTLALMGAGLIGLRLGRRRKG